MKYDQPRSRNLKCNLRRNGSRACRVLGVGCFGDRVMVKPPDKIEWETASDIIQTSICLIVIILCCLLVAFLAYAA